MAEPKRYWLMKSEPGVYSIDDLKRDGSTSWEGVRNYQARNFMRDDMHVGDGVLFYHSSAQAHGHLTALPKWSGEAYPDDTAFDPSSRYYDPKSDPAATHLADGPTSATWTPSRRPLPWRR